MMKEREIVDYLLEYFNSVYCYNCAGQDRDELCEECHRKYMNWELSEEAAVKIAARICGDTNDPV